MALISVFTRIDGALSTDFGGGILGSDQGAYTTIV
jgi:hypothetical protein